MKVGDVLTWDYQSDVFKGQYRLVENLGRGVWRAENLEPSDELIEAARAYYLDSENPYLDWIDPFGPERRRATRQESFDAEILVRIENAGHTFEIQFVSAERFNAAF
jgi:hypothetical protein